MMKHDEAIGCLRKMLDEHNAGLPQGADRVDPDAAIRALLIEGGTTLSGLLELDAADLKWVGFPTGCAKAAVRFIAGSCGTGAQDPAKPTAVRVNIVATAAELSDASATALLSRFNPDEPGRVGDELNDRAGGRAFLGFKSDGTVDVAASAARLVAIRRGDRLGETMIVEGSRAVRPRRVGEAAQPRRVRVNPLFPEQVLLSPDLECAVTGESWSGVSNEVCQLLIIEANRRGGRPWGVNAESARSVIVAARAFDAASEMRRRYKLAAIAYDEMQPHERPSLDRIELTQAPELPQEAGRRGPFVSGVPRAPRSNGELPLRVVIVAAASDINAAIEIDRALATLKRHGLIETLMTAGAAHSDEAHQWVETADVVLPVMSAAALADDATLQLVASCRSGFEARRTRIIPIIHRACDLSFWRATSKATWWFERVKCFPQDGQPLHGHPDADLVLVDLANELRRIISRDQRDRESAADKALIERMQGLLDGEFTEIMDKFGIDRTMFSGPAAPAAIRAAEIVTWARGMGKIRSLEDALIELGVSR